MWLVNAKNRCKKVTDPEFMPYPEDLEGSKDHEDRNNPLGNKALVLQFVKSPSSVNPSMTKQEDIYLQGEDRIYLNVSHRGEAAGGTSGTSGSSGSKQWTTITIPHNYIGSSWPIRVKIIMLRIFKSRILNL